MVWFGWFFRFCFWFGGFWFIDAFAFFLVGEVGGCFLGRFWCFFSNALGLLGPGPWPHFFCPCAGQVDFGHNRLPFLPGTEDGDKGRCMGFPQIENNPTDWFFDHFWLKSF